jgi:hypothetical protein
MPPIDRLAGVESHDRGRIALRQGGEPRLPFAPDLPPALACARTLQNPQPSRKPHAEAPVRQAFLLQRIGDPEEPQIGMRGECRPETFRLRPQAGEVAEREYLAAGARERQERVQRPLEGERRGLAGSLRLRFQQRFQQRQYARLTGARGQDADLPGALRDHRPDAIAAECGDPGEHRRGTHDQRRFQLPPGAEEKAGLQIDEQPHGPLALLAKELGMRPPAARRHPPVDVARIIARDVGADFLKFQSASALRARVRTEQRRARALAAVQREPVRGPAQRQQLAEIRHDHGAGTRLNSSSMQVCADTPRACAV